jgi:hypothetical protein
MYPEGGGQETVEWIYLAQNRDKGRTVVNTVKKIL